MDGATGRNVIEVLRLGMLGKGWVSKEGLEKVELEEEDGVERGTLVEGCCGLDEEFSVLVLHAFM